MNMKQDGLFFADRVGAEEAYLLYDRGRFWRKDVLVGVYSSARDLIKVIGTAWPQQDKQRLYAAYRNGELREIRQTTDLMKPPPVDTNGAT
jgi:hypothetical protein